MKRLISFTSLLLSLLCYAQVKVDIAPTATGNNIIWDTQVGYSYHLEVSTDLETFTDTNFTEAGTGAQVGYEISNSNSQQLFYRVREELSNNIEAFLTAPIHGQESFIEDGVPITFDLSTLGTPPVEILIETRPFGSNGAFTRVGHIDSFTQRGAQHFVRGSVIWIPEQIGDYEVRATAFAHNLVVQATSTRLVSVTHTPRAQISIDSVLFQTGQTFSRSLDLALETTITQTFHPIRLVEFYSNGTLIGTDYQAPFGDDIIDIEFIDTPILFAGTHSIVARAYDNHGLSADSSPFVIQITGNDTRPTLDLVLPTNRKIYLQQGQDLSLNYSVASPSNEPIFRVVFQNDFFPNREISDANAPFNQITLPLSSFSEGTYSIICFVEDEPEQTSHPQIFEIVITDNANISAGDDSNEFTNTLITTISGNSSLIISNPSFKGIQASSSPFTEGLFAGLDFQSGIILSTGNASDWRGVKDTNTIHDTNGTLQRIDDNREIYLRSNILSDLSNIQEAINDAVVLEFDVFCQHSQLELVIQLGSDEYLEFIQPFVQQQQVPLIDICFNDLLLITVDDVPISLLPGSSKDLSIAEVHPFLPAQTANGECLRPTVTPPQNEHFFLGPDDILARTFGVAPDLRSEYDGFVSSLKLHALVKPNSTHRVRISLSDASDAQRDTSLFIRENSLKNTQP